MKKIKSIIIFALIFSLITLVLPGCSSGDNAATQNTVSSEKSSKKSSKEKAYDKLVKYIKENGNDTDDGTYNISHTDFSGENDEIATLTMVAISGDNLYFTQSFFGNGELFESYIVEIDKKSYKYKVELESAQINRTGYINAKKFDIYNPTIYDIEDTPPDQTYISDDHFKLFLMNLLIKIESLLEETPVNLKDLGFENYPW